MFILLRARIILIVMIYIRTALTARKAAATMSVTGKMPLLQRNKTFLNPQVAFSAHQGGHCQKSFTLIELLLVVVLLSVMTTLAIPNFSQSYINLQLRETARDISYLMRYAQGRAVIKRKPHRLVFNGSYTQYWLTVEEDPPSEETNTEEPPEKIPNRFGRVFNIPPEIDIEAPQPSVKFYPDWKIDKTRIYLRNKKEKYFTISTQEQLGHIYVFDFKLE